MSTTKSITPLFAGMIFAASLVIYMLPRIFDPEFDASQFALDEETKTVMNPVNGREVHCSSIKDIQNCLEDYLSDFSDVPLTLWLGNSQLHAVNQFNHGEQTAVARLHQDLITRGNYTIGMSYPNVNLLENFVGYNFVQSHTPVSTVIIPLVFDDTREMGVGPDFEEAFLNANFAKNIVKSAFGEELAAEQVKDIEVNSDTDFSGLSGSVQETVEAELNTLLEEKWTVWSERANYRSQIFGSLYVFRNWVFNISPSSVRKKLPVAYNRNLEAFKALLESAKLNSTKVIIYIAPIRSDYALPYNMKEYEQFKNDVKSISDDFGIKVYTLEQLVPNSMWGQKKSTTIGEDVEIDFMHFRAEGHKLLARELLSVIYEE